MSIRNKNPFYVSNTNISLIFVIAKLVIRLIRNIIEILSSYHLDGDHTFNQHIDSIFELKSSLKIKLKGRPSDAKNKKRS